MSIEDKITWSRVEREGDPAYARDVINRSSSEGALSEEQRQHALKLIDSEGPKQAVDYVANLVDKKDK